MRPRLRMGIVPLLILILSACDDTTEGLQSDPTTPPSLTQESPPLSASSTPRAGEPSPARQNPAGSSPAPAFATVLDAILQADLQFVRVMGRTVNDFPATLPAFFTESDSRVLIFPKTLVPLTPEQRSDLPNRIKIMAQSDRKEVRYTLDPLQPGESKASPLALQLVNAPQEDLLVEFSSSDGKRNKTLNLRYMAPFQYTFTSANDPGIPAYVADLKKGYYKTYYVSPGSSHTYLVQFTHDVRRDTVSQRLAESSGQALSTAMRLDWDNDRQVRLTLDFGQKGTSPAPISFNLNGIRTKDGYPLSDPAIYRFQPALPQALYRVDLLASAKLSLFDSPVHYEEIDMSPNGRYGLAAEVGSNEMRALYAYSIVDRNGNRLQAFDMDAVYLAKWYGDGNSLLYLQQNKFMLYNAATKESQTLWTSPSEGNNERFVSLDIDSVTGSIAVGWGKHDDQGQFTYDLYVFKNLEDTAPAKVSHAAIFRCYEGPCYALGERVFRNGSVEVVDLPPEAADNTKRVVKLANGQEVWIVKQAAVGSETWFRFDPASQTQTPLLETKLGLLQTWAPLMDIGEGRYLIHPPEQPWQLVDTTLGTVAAYDLIPKDVYQVHKLGTELYFFGKGH